MGEIVTVPFWVMLVLTIGTGAAIGVLGSMALEIARDWWAGR